MSDLTDNMITFNQNQVATEIMALRGEVTDRDELIATFAQNGAFVVAEKSRTASVRGRAVCDVQIAVWRAAFDDEIAAATPEQISAAKTMCEENDISTAWF